MSKGSERFHEILKELGELHDRKQADYGTSADPFANVRASVAFGVPAWKGCMMRANDKMVRIQKAAREGKLANEALDDSLRDLAVYAIIGLCLWEETRDETTQGGRDAAEMGQADTHPHVEEVPGPDSGAGCGDVREMRGGLAMATDPDTAEKWAEHLARKRKPWEEK